MLAQRRVAKAAPTSWCVGRMAQRIPRAARRACALYRLADQFAPITPCPAELAGCTLHEPHIAAGHQVSPFRRGTSIEQRLHSGNQR